MITFSAIKYYLSSVPTILSGMSFWKIPLIFFHKPVLVKIRGNFAFFIKNLMDAWTLKEVILDEQYIKYSKVRPDWIVVDIGGALGDFAIIAAQKAKKVYTFEANKNIFQLLKKNILINNCKNIEAYHEKVRSLDKIFKKNRISRCDFLKVDCEGCEYEIFNKISEYTLLRIKRISMEIHLFDRNMEKKYLKLKIHLKKNGFILKETNSPVHGYLKFFFASRAF